MGIAAGATQGILKPGFFFRLLILSAFVFLVSFSNAQKNPEIKKTKSSAVIDGKKYYLHTVDKGQTLYAISRIYDVSLSELTTENPDAIEGIKPGQVLKIPFPEKENKKGKDRNETETGNYYFHKVEQGETVYSIAKRFGLAEEEVLKFNPDVTKEGLKKDQLLRLPGNPKEIKPPGDKKGEEQSGATKPDSVKNNNFNIALFLPFYLSGSSLIDPEKVKKGIEEFPEKSKIAVEYYQGTLLALDSLKAAGLNTAVYVYDTGLDSSGIIDPAKISWLKKMDIIIGPLYTNNFIAMCRYAKENNIPVISPLSQNNKILLGNPFVSKAVPSVITQLEQTGAYISKNYAGQNLMLVENISPKESSYTTTLKQTINAGLKARNSNDSILIVNGIKGISEHLRSDKINVIVIVNSGASYVTDMLSKLNKIKEDAKGRDSLIIFGMQSWSGIESIDFEYLNNLNVHIPSNTFIDYNEPRVKNFISRYRTLYLTEPSDYVYQGYDVTFFYVQAMRHSGKSLQDISKQKWNGLHMNFDLYQTYTGCGFENRGVFILRYYQYQLIRAD